MDSVPPIESRPLVSCIMPTKKRRSFVPLAIAQFLRATYEPRELVIVDEGPGTVEDLIPDDPRIRYVRVPERVLLGPKRNLACTHARGEFIIHWDDDDWYAPGRIKHQVSALVAAEGRGDPVMVCGYGSTLFLFVERQEVWQYHHTQPFGKAQNPYILGHSFCYRRSTWEANPFPNIGASEDNALLNKLPPGAVLQLHDLGQSIVIRHGRNSCTIDPHEGPGWTRHDIETAREIMGVEFANYGHIEKIMATHWIRLSHDWNRHVAGQRAPRAGEYVRVTSDELGLLRSRRHRHDEVVDWVDLPEEARAAIADHEGSAPPTPVTIQDAEQMNTSEQVAPPSFEAMPGTRAVKVKPRPEATPNEGEGDEVAAG